MASCSRSPTRQCRRRGNVDSYSMKTFTYKYQADYGSPEVDQTTPTIAEARVAADNKSVRLYVSGLQVGHITT